MTIVSACLAGFPCRYDGKASSNVIFHCELFTYWTNIG